MPGNSNSGRKADWFREACQDIINQEKLLEFVGRVAAGKEVEERLVSTKTGHDIVSVACDAQTRLSAFKMLAEWGVGKPIQYVVQPTRSPEESVMKVQQMLDLVRAASHRPPLIKQEINGGNGNGANGHP